MTGGLTVWLTEEDIDFLQMHVGDAEFDVLGFLSVRSVACLDVLSEPELPYPEPEGRGTAGGASGGQSRTPDPKPVGRG